eukprot:INCI17927.1.p1 GENE.INCI17927.1~~INCI17927.1.p1  ORF type:complete len:627 (+),score=96.36 INCI17927.1:155-1882(+)
MAALFVGTVLLLFSLLIQTPDRGSAHAAGGAASASTLNLLLPKAPQWLVDGQGVSLNTDKNWSAQPWFGQYNATAMLVFFSHIMKTGGTSLSLLLADTFPSEPCLALSHASKRFSIADRKALEAWTRRDWEACTCMFSHDSVKIARHLLRNVLRPGDATTGGTLAAERLGHGMLSSSDSDGSAIAGSGMIDAENRVGPNRGPLLLPITILRDPVNHRASFFEEKVCHGNHVPVGWDRRNCEWFDNGTLAWVSSEYYARTALNMQLRHVLPDWDVTAIPETGLANRRNGARIPGSLIETRHEMQHALRSSFAWVGVTEEWGVSMCVLFDTFQWQYPAEGAGGDGARQGQRYRARMKYTRPRDVWFPRRSAPAKAANHVREPLFGSGVETNAPTDDFVRIAGPAEALLLQREADEVTLVAAAKATLADHQRTALGRIYWNFVDRTIRPAIALSHIEGDVSMRHDAHSMGDDGTRNQMYDGPASNMDAAVAIEYWQRFSARNSSKHANHEVEARCRQVGDGLILQETNCHEKRQFWRRVFEDRVAAAAREQHGGEYASLCPLWAAQVADALAAFAPVA